jgi:hypothetical protein
MRLWLGVLAILALVHLFPAEAADPVKAKLKGPASTAEKPLAFNAPDDILRFIDGYRAKPRPDQLPQAVKAMSRLGVFKDVESAGVYLGFMAGVLASNPHKAEALVAAMYPMPPEDQVAIVKAIAYSGLANWKGLLGKFVERMPARATLIDRYMHDKLPTLEKMTLTSGPAALDANWGFYFATGAPAAVRRIEAALAWGREANDVEKLTIAGMAKWTLAKNATRDTDLLAMLKRDAGAQEKAIARELADVIEAVETFELGKLRKESIARIDELKLKGPESKRNASWWAQAGTTAIALGCVGAAALGQVELAIPCVVGGPLSTAASRLFMQQ